MTSRLTYLLLIIPFLTSAQGKFPPRDDAAKSPELQTFVRELKEIIETRDGKKLLKRIHPRVKFDFDEGVGIDKFKERWRPEDKRSELWPILNRIVGLGGVFVADRKDPFYDFVFPYVNQVDLTDADQSFNVLVVTGKNVRVRERPDLKSNVVGQLTYDVVTFEYEKSKIKEWYFIKTSDKMFLTHEKGVWMISCLIAGD